MNGKGGNQALESSSDASMQEEWSRVDKVVAPSRRGFLAKALKASIGATAFVLGLNASSAGAQTSFPGDCGYCSTAGNCYFSEMHGRWVRFYTQYRYWNRDGTGCRDRCGGFSYWCD